MKRRSIALDVGVDVDGRSNGRVVFNNTVIEDNAAAQMFGEEDADFFWATLSDQTDQLLFGT